MIIDVMPGKRSRADERQITWRWIDAEELLKTEEDRGPVVFEAPDASRIVAARPPPLPRVRQRRHAGPPPEVRSLGLPFGTRADGPRITCWSCAQAMGEGEVVPTDTGQVVCPGCGARLPFV
jgi:hypothetical protein